MKKSYQSHLWGENRDISDMFGANQKNLNWKPFKWSFIKVCDSDKGCQHQLGKEIFYLRACESV